MNWWLLGICIVLFFLSMRVLGDSYRFKQLVKAMNGFSDIITALTEMPAERTEEVRALWTQAMVRAETSLALTGWWVLGIVMFLIVLVIRGHL